MRRYSARHAIEGLELELDCVPTSSMLVLPRDATKLGIAPDDLSVAEAVRMSMSIPIFFDPVIQENPQDGQCRGTGLQAS